MKFLVLSLLVVACSAVPATFGNYGGSSYGGSRYSFGAASAPRVGLVGGYSGGYSGLSSGLSTGFSGLGSGFNYQKSGYGFAAPAYSYVQAASPAVSYVQAAPAVSYVQAAAPAVSYVQAPAVSYVQAAPAVQTVAFQAAPAQNFAFQQGAQVQQNYLTQHKSDSFQSVVPAAINQVARTVEYRAIANQEQPAQPQTVEIEPSDNPVHLHFKTRSSSLSVSQAHTPAEAQEVQTSSAQDEPQRLITEVQKPVIQEVRETITPYRQVTQEINPVQESLHTIVSKGEQRQQQYVAQKNNYAQQTYTQAAPVQTIAVQAPAVQTVAYQTVQAAPVQAIAVETPVSNYNYNYVQSAPAVQAIAVEAAPVQTFQTVAAAPAFSTQYGARYSAAPVSSSFSSFSAPASSSFSTFSAQKPATFQKQSSFSSSSSGY